MGQVDGAGVFIAHARWKRHFGLFTLVRWSRFENTDYVDLVFWTPRRWRWGNALRLRTIQRIPIAEMERAEWGTPGLNCYCTTGDSDWCEFCDESVVDCTCADDETGDDAPY